MIDFERILEGFHPETFRRQDLRKRRWTLPGIEYWVRLDTYAAWLERTVATLQEQLARDGNQYYRRDAAKWGQKWQDKCIEAGELQSQLITQKAEYEAELRRKDLEIEYLQEQLEAYEEAEQPQSQRKRNSQTGRFVSDLPRKEKVWKAWDMNRRGYRISQIANELRIHTETVKRYIREYEAQRNVVDDEDEEEDETPIWE